MRVITKIVIRIGDGEILSEEGYEYNGPVAQCGGKGGGGGDPTTTYAQSPEQRQMYGLIMPVLERLQQRALGIPFGGQADPTAPAPVTTGYGPVYFGPEGAGAIQGPQAVPAEVQTWLDAQQKPAGEMVKFYDRGSGSYVTVPTSQFNRIRWGEDTSGLSPTWGTVSHIPAPSLTAEEKRLQGTPEAEILEKYGLGGFLRDAGGQITGVQMPYPSPTAAPTPTPAVGEQYTGPLYGKGEPQYQLYGETGQPLDYYSQGAEGDLLRFTQQVGGGPPPLYTQDGVATQPPSDRLWDILPTPTVPSAPSAVGTLTGTPQYDIPSYQVPWLPTPGYGLPQTPGAPGYGTPQIPGMAGYGLPSTTGLMPTQDWWGSLSPQVTAGLWAPYKEASQQLIETLGAGGQAGSARGGFSGAAGAALGEFGARAAKDVGLQAWQMTAPGMQMAWGTEAARRESQAQAERGMMQQAWGTEAARRESQAQAERNLISMGWSTEAARREAQAQAQRQSTQAMWGMETARRADVTSQELARRQQYYGLGLEERGLDYNQELARMQQQQALESEAWRMGIEEQAYPFRALPGMMGGTYSTPIVQQPAPGGGGFSPMGALAGGGVGAGIGSAALAAGSPWMWPVIAGSALAGGSSGKK